jgi:hypothetical protein
LEAGSAFKQPTSSPSVVENFRPPLLVGGSSATLEDDGLEAEWEPPLHKGDGAATEGLSIGWTVEGGLVESWTILGFVELGPTSEVLSFVHHEITWLLLLWKLPDGNLLTD